MQTSECVHAAVERGKEKKICAKRFPAVGGGRGGVEETPGYRVAGTLFFPRVSRFVKNNNYLNPAICAKR